MDVGCGDGRFLRELGSEYPDVTATGIDYSKRAIDMAKALNPGLDFRCVDLRSDEVNMSYNVVTLIEVLEHIPPDDIDSFLDAITDIQDPTGRTIITVPHENKPVQDKHFQHFSGAGLRDLLTPHFERIDLVPFDDIESRGLKLARKLIGGRGSNVVVTNDWINQRFFDLYLDRYLYVPEAKCGRIAAVCQDPK
ncbi:SAM-dependent methyltransferase [Halorhabdus sp. SVX81]|nr:SAM-dependent methyltransferase [Halorhabdus sp. SVX81]